MFCSKCGAETKKDSKFCAYCGNDLTAQAEKVKKQTKKKEEVKEDVKEEVKETKPEVKQEVKPVTTTAPAKQGGGKGTASLVIGIINIVFPILVLPLSIVGLILGIAEKEKDGKRTAGIIMNAIELGLSLIVTVFVVLVFIGIVNSPEFYNITNTTNTYNSWNNTVKTYKSSTTKTVGSYKYGYVDVPKSWVTFKDTSVSTELIQYTDIGEKGYIVTLNVYDQDITAYQASTNVYNHIKDEGVTPTRTYVKIGDYWAWKVSAYYSSENKYLDTYLFKASDDKLHYVAIEGPDKYNDNFKIPDTFRMTR